MGGGSAEVGEEDVHGLLWVHVVVPARVVRLAVDAADEEYGQVRRKPLQADPQVQQLLPARAIDVVLHTYPLPSSLLDTRGLHTHCVTSSKQIISVTVTRWLITVPL